MDCNQPLADRDVGLHISQGLRDIWMGGGGVLLPPFNHGYRVAVVSTQKRIDASYERTMWRETEHIADLVYFDNRPDTGFSPSSVLGPVFFQRN